MAVAAIAWILRLYPWQWWVRDTSLVPPVSYGAFFSMKHDKYYSNLQQNADGRIQFNLDNEFVPDTEQKITEKVKFAYENNRHIRVLADGHSWSEVAQTQDIMISLANYKGLVDPDAPITNDEATFKAGTPLREISKILEERGYAMIQLGSVAGQSIAGAISTGMLLRASCHPIVVGYGTRVRRFTYDYT